MSATGIMLDLESKDELMKALGAYKANYEQASKEIAANGKMASETKERLEKLTEDVVKLHDRIQNEYQKRMDAIDAALKAEPWKHQAPKSIGEQVIEDPGIVALFKSSGRGSASVQVKGPIGGMFERKDITGLSLLLPQILPGVAIGPRLPFGVRSLIPQGRTTAGAVEFVRESSFTNNAAPVAEAAAKPKSDKTFTVITSNVRTIAHYFKISDQTADDLPFVLSQLENNGIYGVQLAEDNQLLNGNGTAPNLDGLVKNAAAATAPAATGSNLVDAIGTAIFQLAAAGFAADGTVTNPADWGHVALLKNAQGNYLFANPLDYTVGGRIWGTRVAQSANMAAGTFLVGAFAGHTQILDREDVFVQVANQNEDDFIKNMYTVLIEERLALCIYQPLALLKGVVPAGSLLTAEGAEGESPRQGKRL